MQRSLGAPDKPLSVTTSFAAFRRAGQLRNIAAGLAALAVVIQIWVPLVHSPLRIVVTQASALARTSFFGDKLALCLASTKERRDSPTQIPAHKPSSCPICFTSQELPGFVPPAARAVLANPPLTDTARFIAPTLIVIRPLDPISQPRAPPVMA
jgi:hypothetical protein